MKNVLLALSLGLCLTASALAQDRLSGKAFATRAVVMAQHGMACTSHPLSTQAAIEVLRAGGTAIDAAIAANAMEGVVEPHMNGTVGTCSRWSGRQKPGNSTASTPRGARRIRSRWPNSKSGA